MYKLNNLYTDKQSPNEGIIKHNLFFEVEKLVNIIVTPKKANIKVITLRENIFLTLLIP